MTKSKVQIEFNVPEQFEKDITGMLDLCNEFISAAEAGVHIKGINNKKARKLSIEMGKAGKVFRKSSVDFEKYRRVSRGNL